MMSRGFKVGAAMVAALAMTMTMACVAEAGRPDDRLRLGRAAAKELTKAEEAFAAATRDGVERAVSLMTDFLAQDRWSEDERSLAHEYRGRALMALGEDRYEAALADLQAALASGPATGARAAVMRTLVIDLLTRTGRPDEAVAVFEAHEDGLREHAFGEAVTNVVPAYVAQRAPDRAFALLRDAAEQDEYAGAELHAMRYAMALQMRRWDEAEAALGAHGNALYQAAPYVETARARFAALRTEAAPTKAALREAAQGFLNDEVTWRSENVDAQPIMRVPPQGFEHCISRLAAGRDRMVTIRLEFDVTETGETDDVRVLESDGRCYEDSAIESARQWRYAPNFVDGVPVRREGVRTNIKYQISG